MHSKQDVDIEAVKTVPPHDYSTASLGLTRASKSVMPLDLLFGSHREVTTSLGDATQGLTLTGRSCKLSPSKTWLLRLS